MGLILDARHAGYSENRMLTMTPKATVTTAVATLSSGVMTMLP